MLRGVAAVSLVYDIGVGVTLFFFRELLQVWFGVPAPQPPIHADLNAIFVTSVGVGYLLPLRDPVRYRAYLWIFGVALKGAGAVAFVLDYVLRGSPPAFLLFAVSDGALSALTLGALAASRSRMGNKELRTKNEERNLEHATSNGTRNVTPREQ